MHMMLKKVSPWVGAALFMVGIYFVHTTPFTYDEKPLPDRLAGCFAGQELELCIGKDESTFRSENEQVSINVKYSEDKVGGLLYVERSELAELLKIGLFSKYSAFDSDDVKEVRIGYVHEATIELNLIDRSILLRQAASHL